VKWESQPSSDLTEAAGEGVALVVLGAVGRGRLGIDPLDPAEGFEGVGGRAAQRIVLAFVEAAQFGHEVREPLGFPVVHQ